MKEHCIWCNRRDESLRQIVVVVPNRLGLRPRERALFICSSDCEHRLRKFNDHVRRFGFLFLSLIGLSLASLVALLFVLPKALIPVGLGSIISFIGAALMVFPFPTPETVRLLGVRRSVALVRSLGVLLLVMGVLAALRLFPPSV
jgi:predicted nucleic acid-binding Zn ribbon protein